MAESKLEMKKAIVADLQELYRNLSDQDADECRSFGLLPEDAILTSALASGDNCWAARINGDLVAVFGGGKDSTETALTEKSQGWILTTKAARKHRKEFVKHARAVSGILVNRFAPLYNFIDTRYLSGMKWLSSLGFYVNLKDRYQMPGGSEAYLVFHLG